MILRGVIPVWCESRGTDEDVGGGFGCGSYGCGYFESGYGDSSGGYGDGSGASDLVSTRDIVDEKQ